MVFKDFDPGTLVLLQDVLQIVLMIGHTGQLHLIRQVNRAVNV